MPKAQKAQARHLYVVRAYEPLRISCPGRIIGDYSSYDELERRIFAAWNYQLSDGHSPACYRLSGPGVTIMLPNPVGWDRNLHAIEAAFKRVAASGGHLTLSEVKRHH